MQTQDLVTPEHATIELNPKDFFADIVGSLAGTLQDVIGAEEAAAFISVVGDSLGLEIGALYAAELDGLPQEPDLIGRILVDLKRRIGGSFRIESISDGEIVLRNGHCPFGGRVVGRGSLCMMTTNVFGRIAAEATGYARVHVTESIARGNSGCRVVVSLKRGQDDAGTVFYS